MDWLLAELTFLVIDDSGFTRKVIRNALSGYGVRNVIEAEDAVAGLAVLRAADRPVDIILVDQEMPVLDGTDFTRIVRRDDTLPNSEVPIIMVTAYSDRDHVAEASKAGVNAFVSKPFSPEQLHDHIVKVLRHPQVAAQREAVQRQPARDLPVDAAFEELSFLVIDDSGFARRLVKTALGSYGVTRITLLEDAVAGLEVLRDANVRVDVVLVDREMPVFDGIEFTRLVRRDPKMTDPEVPILMVSGVADRERVKEAQNAGIDGFVAKPFSPEQLHDRVVRVLENRRARAAGKAESGDVFDAWEI